MVVVSGVLIAPSLAGAHAAGGSPYGAPTPKATTKSPASKSPTAKAPMPTVAAKVAAVATPAATPAASSSAPTPTATATATATTSAGGIAIDCSGTTILVMSSTTIYTLDTSTMVSKTLFTLPSPVPGGDGGNALAVNYDGTRVYYVDRNVGQIKIYNVTTGQVTPGPAADKSTLAGAVNPVNGDYYFSASAGTKLYVYNPTTMAVSLVGQETGGTSENGDLVFDRQGNGYYVGDYNLFRFSPTADASGNVVFTKLSTGFPFGADGIAFSGDGYLYTTDRITPGQIEKVNPITGAIIATSVATGPDGAAINTDAGSCSSQPGTASLKKNLPSGRAVAGDQFSLTISSTGIVGGNTATTTGSASGVQAAVAGPVLGLGGTTFTIKEAAVSGTLDRYTSSWSCINTLNGNAVVASGTGTSGSFSFPNPIRAGENVVCTFTNVAIASGVDAATITNPVLASTGGNSSLELLIAALAVGVGGLLTLAGRRR